MGRWQIQALSFGTCIFMPVFCFWYYHQSDVQKEYLDRYYAANVTERSIKSDKMIKEYQQRMRALHDKRFEKELADINAAKEKEN